MDKIIDYLKQLELSDTEAKLYLTLLKTGPTSVRDLAATIEIKRTTAYLYIDLLIEKGLIMKIVKGSEKFIAANPPEESLEHLVKDHVEKAKNIQLEFPTMIQTLTTSLPQIREVGEAEIKYYKGRNGVQKIYEEALKAKELRSFVNITIMADTLPENAKIFAHALKNNKNIKIYEIIEESPVSKEQTQFQSNNADNERYFYKFLPHEVKLSAADTLIYDGKVSIINVRNSISGIVLTNTDYYHNSKELFDFIWKVLPASK